MRFFLTNSIIGIWPVIEIKDICKKAKGKITKSLQYAIEQRLNYATE